MSSKAIAMVLEGRIHIGGRFLLVSTPAARLLSAVSGAKVLCVPAFVVLRKGRRRTGGKDL